MKRLFDIAVSLAALLALSPLLLVLVLWIRLRMGSPVLFRQTRPGLGGNPFEMLKLRTMTDECDRHGRTLPDSRRLTALGRFLRATSLDELPELISVLRGDMSLVGPRPLLMCYLQRYSPEQARRHEVRPGLTGWAQIKGRNTIGWDEKFRYDVWYVDNRSFLLDLRILLYTCWHVLCRKGITADDHATMPEFMGSAGPRSMSKGEKG